MSDFAFSFSVSFLPAVFFTLFSLAGIWIGAVLATALTGVDWHSPSASGFPGFLGMLLGMLAGIAPGFFLLLTVLDKGAGQ